MKAIKITTQWHTEGRKSETVAHEGYITNDGVSTKIIWICPIKGVKYERNLDAQEYAYDYDDKLRLIESQRKDVDIELSELKRVLCPSDMKAISRLYED